MKKTKLKLVFDLIIKFRWNLSKNKGISDIIMCMGGDIECNIPRMFLFDAQQL